MSETRKIVIEIVGKQDDQQSKGVAQKLSSPNTPATNRVGIDLASSVVVNQAYQHIKGVVKNTGMYHINKHFTLKENYLMEQQLNNALTGINKAVGFGTALVGGFMVGNVAGAVVAGVGWGINETVGAYKRYDQAALQLQTTATQLAFAQQRAGLSNESRGTLN